MAKPKVSLVKIKELRAQLELKEEKKSERQLAELQAHLERKTQRTDQS